MEGEGRVSSWSGTIMLVRDVLIGCQLQTAVLPSGSKQGLWLAVDAWHLLLCLTPRLHMLQGPLTTPIPADPAHFWQCCYGAHPRCLVLAEQSGVSLGDFRVSCTANISLLSLGDSCLVSVCQFSLVLGHFACRLSCGS